MITSYCERLVIHRLCRIIDKWTLAEAALRYIQDMNREMDGVHLQPFIKEVHCFHRPNRISRRALKITLKCRLSLAPGTTHTYTTQIKKVMGQKYRQICISGTIRRKGSLLLFQFISLVTWRTVVHYSEGSFY